MTDAVGRRTPTGFVYGPATVRVITSEPKHGVWIEVSGKRQSVEVRVTPSGLLRVGKVK